MSEKNQHYHNWLKYNDYVMLILCTSCASSWEQKFLLDIQKKYAILSDKQKLVLEKIITKYYPCGKQNFLLKSIPRLNSCHSLSMYEESKIKKQENLKKF